MLGWLFIFLGSLLVHFIFSKFKTSKRWKVILKSGVVFSTVVTLVLFFVAGAVFSIAPVTSNGLIELSEETLVKRSNSYGGSVANSTRVYSVSVNGKTVDRSVPERCVLVDNSGKSTSISVAFGLPNKPAATTYFPYYSNKYFFVPMYARDKVIILSVPGGTLD